MAVKPILAVLKWGVTVTLWGKIVYSSREFGLLGE